MGYEITPRPQTIERVLDVIKKEKSITITRLYKATNVYYSSLKSVLRILQDRGLCKVEETDVKNQSGGTMTFSTITYTGLKVPVNMKKK